MFSSLNQLCTKTLTRSVKHFLKKNLTKTSCHSNQTVGLGKLLNCKHGYIDINQLLSKSIIIFSYFFLFRVTYCKLYYFTIHFGLITYNKVEYNKVTITKFHICMYLNKKFNYSNRSNLPHIQVINMKDQCRCFQVRPSILNYLYQLYFNII